MLRTYAIDTRKVIVKFIYFQARGNNVLLIVTHLEGQFKLDSQSL